MRFPMISDIATTAVISIDMNKTVADALEVMLHQEHRSIIITEPLANLQIHPLFQSFWKFKKSSLKQSLLMF